MKNKKIIYTIIILLCVIFGVWGFVSSSKQNVKVPQQIFALPGQHCGGNMTTAASCTVGYHCAPTPGSHLPFGDVGGTCVKD